MREARSRSTPSVTKNSIQWYKVDGSPIGGLPSAGGVSPAFFVLGGELRGLILFIDESGSDNLRDV